MHSSDDSPRSSGAKSMQMNESGEQGHFQFWAVMISRNLVNRHNHYNSHCVLNETVSTGWVAAPIEKDSIRDNGELLSIHFHIV